MRTLRTIGVVGSAMALLLSASVVFANEGQATSTRGENVNESNYRSMSASTTARMQTVRDEAQTRMESQRTKIENRLSDIKDQAKQEMAKTLAGQFNNLNKTWTDNFMQLLDKYDALLVKVQDRATVAASAGKDIATTTTAVQLAKTAILNARTAVVAQAAKTYALNPTTIPTIPATATEKDGQDKIMKGLRTSFQNMHSTLFKDLFALRDGAMKDARKAVQNSIQTLGAIPGVDGDNATSTEKKSN